MTIHVTQADIQGGEPRNCYKCPVAMALLRHTGRKVLVSPLRIADGDKIIVTPPALGNWIANYDQDYTVKPFSFELDI